MINTTYGAGYRAGMAESRIQRPGGTRGIKMIVQPDCPFPGRRFVSAALWHAGYHAGMMKKITGHDQPLPLFLRIDPMGVAIFVGLFIIFKVL